MRKSKFSPSLFWSILICKILMQNHLEAIHRLAIRTKDNTVLSLIRTVLVDIRLILYGSIYRTNLGKPQKKLFFLVVRPLIVIHMCFWYLVKSQLGKSLKGGLFPKYWQQRRRSWCRKTRAAGENFLGLNCIIGLTIEKL